MFSSTKDKKIKIQCIDMLMAISLNLIIFVKKCTHEN